MSGKFFDKSRIDMDEVSRLASDLSDLASNAETYRDEIDSYKDELETAQGDLEDAETKEDVEKVIGRLRDIVTPDGYDDSDGSPGGIAEELENLEPDVSEYDKWQEDCNAKIKAIGASIADVSCGRILPSSKKYDYSLDREDQTAARIVASGGLPSEGRVMPSTAETEAWKKALLALASGASCVHKPGMTIDERGREAESLVAEMLDLVCTFMSRRGSDGLVCRPTEQPLLALMWFVDAILHHVGLSLGFTSGTRVVVTTVAAMRRLNAHLQNLENEFQEGCEKIDESVGHHS